MSLWLLPFTMIGAGLVTWVICLFIGEVVRSLRQSIRVATVVSRRIKFKRYPSLREIAFAFRREFLSSYDTLIIGFIEIPHSPSMRMRRRYMG